MVNGDLRYKKPADFVGRNPAKKTPKSTKHVPNGNKDASKDNQEKNAMTIVSEQVPTKPML